MIALAVVTAGGLGLLRPAPGTWGSLPPVLITATLVMAAPEALVAVLASLTVLASICCIWLTPWAEAHFETPDPGQVVIDEVAGMSLTLLMLAVPPFEAPRSGLAGLAVLAGGFAAFRLFDILKPEPINALQRLPQGWGVLMDDLMAGLFAATLVLLVLATTRF